MKLIEFTETPVIITFIHIVNNSESYVQYAGGPCHCWMQTLSNLDILVMPFSSLLLPVCLHGHYDWHCHKIINVSQLASDTNLGTLLIQSSSCAVIHLKRFCKC